MNILQFTRAEMQVFFFYVLLTVRLSIILVINQLSTQNLVSQ